MVPTLVVRCTMDKNTKIVPITLIINMNVEQIYFLRTKQFEFNIKDHCKSLIEKKLNELKQNWKIGNKTWN